MILAYLQEIDNSYAKNDTKLLNYFHDPDDKTCQKLYTQIVIPIKLTNIYANSKQHISKLMEQYTKTKRVHSRNVKMAPLSNL